MLVTADDGNGWQMGERDENGPLNGTPMERERQGSVSLSESVMWLKMSLAQLKWDEPE